VRWYYRRLALGKSAVGAILRDERINRKSDKHGYAIPNIK
jgi:hypothetical protein